MGEADFVLLGDLILDRSRREIWRQGDREACLAKHSYGERREAVHLTRRECQLLEVFMTHPGEILNHELLMQEVWDTKFMDDIRILYAYIHRLRRKMEEVGEGRIHTVRGVGYRFEALR